MLNVFKGTLLSLTREKSLFIWSLLFPIILSTMFVFMFSNLDSESSFKPVSCVVVTDANYDDAAGLSDALDELSKPGDSQILDPVFVKTEDEARAMLTNNREDDNPDNKSASTTQDNFGAVGYLVVDDKGQLRAHLKAGAAPESLHRVNQSILQAVADGYVRNAAIMEDIAHQNPSLLAKPDELSHLLAAEDITEQIDVTRNQPKESVRYYFALFGMAALFGGQIGLIAICRTQPNLGPLGARRAVGGVSRAKTLAATLAASWLLSFVCLVIAFGYVRFVAGVDFGGRDASCILVLAVAALTATALGTLFGALPKISEGVKGGILTGIACFAALFAGLYGEPTMELADAINQAVPALQYLNPTSQIASAFYSVMYYDSPDRMVEHLVALLVMAAVLFAISSLFMRRLRYASI